MTQFSNKPIAVIKVGGDMLLNSDDRLGFALNVKDLVDAGWSCVVLHGGGPQLNILQELYGLVPTKIDGRRITGEADLQVVKQALCGEVNVDLVSALIGQNLAAFGCHGASGRLIQAEKRPPINMGEHGVIDFGEVGDVVGINIQLIHALLNAEQVPVIASLGVNKEGRVFNINADNTVAAIAKALSADLLILSTKIGGIFKDINNSESRIPIVTPALVKVLIDEKIITDGMIPKVQESLDLLNNGVKSIVIANASIKGGFLTLANGNDHFGTRLMNDH